MEESSRSDNNMGLKKGPWKPEEDEKLLSYIQQHGHGSWRSLPSRAGLQRCGKSCRLRWINYLRPDIKRGKFSLQEEQTIIQLHALLGNRWSAIASHLPKRTDNEIKNYWNTHLKKRLTKMGIDPISHKPKDLPLDRFQSKEIANISHLAQWETARLQAEARLVRESRLPYRSAANTAAAAPPRMPISRPPCLDILKVWEWTNPGKDISSFILNGPQNMSIVKPNNYEAKGIMGNSLELGHTTSDSTYVDGSLGFPCFVDGYDDLQQNDVVLATGSSENALGGCWGVLEECKIWSMGSPMF